MTGRITLNIGRVTLPAGTRLDAAALQAALRVEIARHLAAPGGAEAFGAGRNVARLGAGTLPASAPLATALARATIAGVVR